MTKRKTKRRSLRGFGSAAPIHLESARIADIQAGDAASAAADFADNAAYRDPGENCMKAADRLERAAYFVGRAAADRLSAGVAAPTNPRVLATQTEARLTFNQNCLKGYRR